MRRRRQTYGDRHKRRAVVRTLLKSKIDETHRRIPTRDSVAIQAHR
jgi:hypothetical protein